MDTLNNKTKKILPYWRERNNCTVILTLTMWNVMLWHSHKTLEKNCQHTLYSHLHYYSFHSNFEEKCTNFIASCFIARTIIMKNEKRNLSLKLICAGWFYQQLFSDIINRKYISRLAGAQWSLPELLGHWMPGNARRAFINKKQQSFLKQRNLTMVLIQSDNDIWILLTWDLYL